jgi:hypothetical protein
MDQADFGLGLTGLIRSNSQNMIRNKIAWTTTCTLVEPFTGDDLDVCRDVVRSFRLIDAVTCPK